MKQIRSAHKLLRIFLSLVLVISLAGSVVLAHGDHGDHDQKSNMSWSSWKISV